MQWGTAVISSACAMFACVSMAEANSIGGSVILRTMASGSAVRNANDRELIVGVLHRARWIWGML